MISSAWIAWTLLACLAITLASATRTRKFARWAGGLPAQYRWHHMLGLLSLGLLLLHIAHQFYSTPSDLWSLFFDWRDPGLLAAWTAAGLFTVAFAASYLRRLKYSRWLKLHLLFAPAIATGLLHAALYGPVDGTATWINWIAIGLGAAALAWLLLARRFPGARERFVIVELKHPANRLSELVLRAAQPARNRLRPAAGSVVFARFTGPGFTHAWHPFSVASCQFSPEIRLLIKAAGHDTTELQKLSAGAEVWLIGPFADLPAFPDEDQIWIAGGAGVAPFLGWLRCLPVRKFKRAVLFYFVNAVEDAAARDELARAGADCADFQSTTSVVPEGARPLLDPVLTAARDLDDPAFLVCGPAGFMRYVRNQLQLSGVRSERIFTEEFVA
jgi:predicted ferric reductase